MNNLRAVRIIALETFLLLRRDRMFAPALVLALAACVLALLASDWSIEDFRKILYDVGYFGFQITGGLVALVWGTKTVSDSRQEGSLEVQLAAPVPRAAWLVGKYLGLAFSLALLAVLLLALWQASLLVFGFGLMTHAQVSVFAFMALGWEVLGALALALAATARQGVAMFSTVALWGAGLTTSLVAASLAPSTPEGTKALVTFLARFWDFQQFNLIDHALDAHLLPAAELGWRAAYGGLLILALLSVACVVFSRRDGPA